MIDSQDHKIVISVNMSNNQIVINPSTSGNQVTVEFPILSEYEKLVTKYRENLKLPEQTWVQSSLFNARLVVLLTEEDPMLSPIFDALQKKVEKLNANSHYLNQFTKICISPTGCSTWMENLFSLYSTKGSFKNFF